MSMYINLNIKSTALQCNLKTCYYLSYSSDFDFSFAEVLTCSIPSNDVKQAHSNFLKICVKLSHK